MSVDYTSWVAFGISRLIDGEQSTPEVAKHIADKDGDMEDSMETWLKANGFPSLSFVVSGNAWTGIERWNVYVTRTAATVFESEPISYLVQPTADETFELLRAIELLGVTDETPQWILQMDVS